MFLHHSEYYILKCFFSWCSQEHMKRPKVLFCSIFINIWEKRKLGVLKRKKKFFVLFFLSVCLALFLFSSFFSLIKVSLIYPFMLLSLVYPFCLPFGTLPAVGFILSFLHLLNLTQYLEHSPLKHLAGHLSSYLHLSPRAAFLSTGCYVDKGIGKNFLPLPLSIPLGSSHHAKRGCETVFWYGSKSSTENDLSIWAWFYGAQGWKF